MGKCKDRRAVVAGLAGGGGGGDRFLLNYWEGEILLQGVVVVVAQQGECNAAELKMGKIIFYNKKFKTCQPPEK
jgi:hypothetical protein